MMSIGKNFDSEVKPQQFNFKKMNIYTLRDYIQRLKDLQDGKRAPHKPFLLLIIIKMLESGELCENRIPFREIREKKSFFADMIAVFNRGNASNWQPNIHTPFFHLKTNGFWHLDPPELQSRPAGDTPTDPQLRNMNATAKLDAALFCVLSISEYREILRQTLIDRYFPELRQAIEYLTVEQEAEEYSEQLIQAAEHSFLIQRDVASIQVETPVRSAGFRKAIMKIYDHTCAVCELNIRASTGESVTDAAHIIPFSVSYNDDIRNGMSLCKSHHWAFDTGLISLNDDYQVIVSPLMSEQGPIGGMLAQFRDRPIWTPEDDRYHPNRDALAWHRMRVLRG